MTAVLLASLVAICAGAMPEPPTRVKYVASKGDVTFDHAAHVARREACRRCHGDGPARKIQIEKKSAHQLCLGCHLEKRVGPKGCTECHDDA